MADIEADRVAALHHAVGAGILGLQADINAAEGPVRQVLSRRHHGEGLRAIGAAEGPALRHHIGEIGVEIVGFGGQAAIAGLERQQAVLRQQGGVA